MTKPMKSLIRTFSFGPSVRKELKSSGSEYSYAMKDCIGPFPVPNQKTRTFNNSATLKRFLADSEGSDCFSQRLITCGATFISFASRVTENPAAAIAAFNRNPKVGIVFILPKEIFAGFITVNQDGELFCFAAASQSRVPPRVTDCCSRRSSACLMAGGFFRFHTHSLPFFTQGVTGNSTIKGGYSHE